jgi:group I intron endonuclease
MAVIYLITNVANGKKYVGQTLQVATKRWQRHHHLAATGSKTALHNAIRKYGYDAFEFSIIETCSLESVNECECYWIAQLDTMAPTGYNLTRGGDGFKGKHTGKTKEAIRKVMVLRGMSEKTRAAGIKANTGAKRSDETRAKMSAAAKKRGSNRKGAVLSLETRAKVSEALKKAWSEGQYDDRAPRTKH